MKKRHILLLVISAALIISSCEKENTQSAGFLTINDYDEVNLHAHDTLIAGNYYDQEVYEIDMDGDGQKDVAFWSVITGSPGMGPIPQAGLMAIHEGAFLYEQNFKDSIFKHTEIDTLDYNRVEIYTNNFYTCGKESPGDSLLRIEEGTSITLMKHGQIGALSSAIWKADSLALGTSSFSSRYYVEEETPDTIKVRRDVFNTCHYLMSNEIYYTGYQNEYGKLGWIKFSVADGFRISVIETAIEK